MVCKITHKFMGKLVRDKVTGFTGICTGRAVYLYGCDQFSIAPPANVSEGTLGATYWFDEGRIEVIGEGVTVGPRMEIVGPTTA